MQETYPSGSILIFHFSGVSGSAYFTNDIDHIPIFIKDNKGYIHINKPLNKSELINNYMMINADEYYVTKYRMTC